MKIAVCIVCLIAAVRTVPFEFSHGDHQNDYVGCYHDYIWYSLEFPLPSLTQSNMTIEACVSHCAAQQQESSRVLFAGLQWGTECHCFELFPRNLSELSGYSSAACYRDDASPCAGNPLQICGGIYDRLSVYCASGCNGSDIRFPSSSCRWDVGCSDCEPRYGQCTGNCTEEDRVGPFCLTSCPPHYHGAECEYWCGGCEQERCDHSTGLCVTGCKDHFHGGNCNDCADGWSGTYCDTECPDNCITCERHNYNQCLSCPDGFYGDSCTETCRTNCKKCEIFSGTCLRCSGSYYGEVCDQKCEKGCMTCDIRTGRCDSCVDGFYGESCSSLCPALCKDRKCDMASGKCEGCLAGSHGSSCEIQCNKCDSCKQNDGSCVSECQPGWYGVKCELQCPEHCVKGECHKNNGSCVSCPPTRAGDQCEEVQETDSNTGLYAGIGVLSLLVVLVVVALVIKEARKKFVRKAPESTEQDGYENIGMTNQSLTDVTRPPTVPQPRPQQGTEPVAKPEAARVQHQHRQPPKPEAARVQHQPRQPPKPAVSSKPSAARTLPPAAARTQPPSASDDDGYMRPEPPGVGPGVYLSMGQARTQPPSAPGGEYIEICKAVESTDGAAGREYDAVNVQDIDTTPKLYAQLNVPGNNPV